MAKKQKQYRREDGKDEEESGLNILVEGCLWVDLEAKQKTSLYITPPIVEIFKESYRSAEFFMKMSSDMSLSEEERGVLNDVYEQMACQLPCVNILH